MGTPTFWALSGLGGAAAVAYGVFFLNRKPGFLRAIVKTLFMGALAAAFAVGHGHPVLITALAAAALGDFFLAFDKKWLLPLGIIAFLIAQLGYLTIFFFNWMFAGDNAPLWPRYAGMALVLACLAAFLAWFWRIPEMKRAPWSGAVAVLAPLAIGLVLPAYLLSIVTLLGKAQDKPDLIAVLPLGALLVAAAAFTWLRRDLGVIRLAAMIYAGVITLMACAAMWIPWPAWAAMLGALFFLVSDFVLAAELFRLPADATVKRYTTPAVWWTYVAAQALIIIGVTQLR
ncbi:lysoplasmalogenase family protein [Terricaulis sp.]|uniref:lysoplasmalogenase family protein n=1 Tax=Terricaulis sp. TaxID=2768686 RepID=UPI0037844D08